jgi:hypothetical protein
MKAKDYARKWEESDKSKEALSKIWFSFLDELSNLIKSRGLKTGAAAAGCVREIDTKWRSFAGRTNGEINPDAFRILLFQKAPHLRPCHEEVWPRKPFPKMPERTESTRG